MTCHSGFFTHFRITLCHWFKVLVINFLIIFAVTDFACICTNNKLRTNLIWSDYNCFCHDKFANILSFDFTDCSDHIFGILAINNWNIIILMHPEWNFLISCSDASLEWIEIVNSLVFKMACIFNFEFLFVKK